MIKSFIFSIVFGVLSLMLIKGFKTLSIGSIIFLIGAISMSLYEIANGCSHRDIKNLKFIGWTFVIGGLILIMLGVK